MSLHYNGDDSYLFVNGKEVTKLKAKDSEIKPYSLCLGNISKDFSSTNGEKARLHMYIYDFSLDYWSIGNNNIQDLMKKKYII